MFGFIVQLIQISNSIENRKKKKRKFTRLIAIESLVFVWDKIEFSLESFFTAKGVEVAIPLIRLLLLVIGNELVAVTGFFVGSWLNDRLFLCAILRFGLLSLVIEFELFSKREIRFLDGFVVCWALSCNFWSSDRCESSFEFVFGTKSVESSRISTSLVSFSFEKMQMKEQYFYSIDKRRKTNLRRSK